MRFIYTATWNFILIILINALLAENGGYNLDTANVENNGHAEKLQRIPRIISGRLADKNAYPYIVSIQAKLHNGIHTLLFGGMEHFCGGTLINQNWILTAAHCLYAYSEDGDLIPLLDIKQWHVRMATGKLRPSILERVKGFFNRAFNTFFGYSKLQTFYHISKILVHPDYVEGFLENDIALMRLKEPVLIHRMQTLDYISLPSKENFEDWPKIGQTCTALGWGCACARCQPEMYMQVLKMPVVGAKECREMYKAPINLTETKEFCAGFYNGNTGICPGDSGGPLVCDFEGKPLLAGVVSATHAKRPESYPAVFTRVTCFRDWINSTVFSN